MENVSNSESVGVFQFAPYIDSAKYVRNSDLTIGEEIPRATKAFRIAGEAAEIFRI